MEQWQEIPGFPNYAVSNQGRVANVRTGRVLKGGVIPAGYLQVTLRRDITNFNKYIHILVAEAFLGPRPYPGWEVNHIHEPKLDNRVVNLEWVSASDNVLHSYRTGLRKTKKVRIVESGEIFKNASELAYHLGVSRSYVSNHLSGKILNVRGLHIEYLN